MGAGKAKERARPIAFRASSAAMGAAIRGQRELGACACELSQAKPFCREACMLPAPGRRALGSFVPFSVIIFVDLEIFRILKPLLCPLEKVAAGIS